MIHRFVDLLEVEEANDPIILYKLHHGVGGTLFERYWLGGGLQTPEPVNDTLGNEAVSSTSHIIVDGRLSPDGTKVAWTRVDNRSGTAVADTIMVCNSDDSGTPVTVVTAEGNAGTQSCRFPCWHPDSTKLIYVTTGSVAGVRYAEIRQVNANGTGDTLLYSRKTSDGLLLVNIDYGVLYNHAGTQICWLDQSQSVASNTNAGIWRMNADGSSPTQLVNWSATGANSSDRQLGWSHDDSMIAYTDTTSGTVAQKVVDMSGTVTTMVSNNNVLRGQFDYQWLPDDSGIVVVNTIYGTEPRGVLYTLTVGGTLTAISPERRVNIVGGRGWAPVVFGERIYYTDMPNERVCSILQDGSDFRIDHQIDTTNLVTTNDQEFRTFLIGQ